MDPIIEGPANIPFEPTELQLHLLARARSRVVAHTSGTLMDERMVVTLDSPNKFPTSDVYPGTNSHGARVGIPVGATLTAEPHHRAATGTLIVADHPCSPTVYQAALKHAGRDVEGLYIRTEESKVESYGEDSIGGFTLIDL